MSEEYNRYDLGNDPEEKSETAATTENVSAENTSYAFSYRKAGEERKDQGNEESFTRTYTGSHREYTHDAGQNQNSDKSTQTPYSSYHFSSQIPPEPEKKMKNKKKKNKGGQMSFGKRLGMAAATAAVFGLVAGSVFVGVTYTGNQLLPEKESTKIENTQTSSGSVDSGSLINQKSSSDSGSGVSEVARNVMPSVVSITGISIQEIPNYFGFGTQKYEGQSSGSGIIVGQNDTELLIATNNHVVKDTNSITVCFTNQDGTAAVSDTLTDTSTNGGDTDSQNVDLENAVEAKIKGTDADNDLAVVAVKIEDIPEDLRSQIKVATLGDSDSLVIGEQVVAIGNALGYGQSVTSGYVSALNKKVSSENADSTFIQTDAAINPGNSGGALLNMKGELIGINSAKIASDEVEGMGFAIPISKAQPILDELMSKETRDKVEDENKAAYIGITCKNVTSDAAEYYNMPLGVFVDSVSEDGPADKAGIQAGDIIRKIDGTSVETFDNLTEQLSYYEAGEKIDFVISRANGGEYKEQTVTVELGAKKDIQNNTENRRGNR
nr:trypsin-like peptidase domain-containing protein [uncultured Blautia sp.]